jgi:hypothetical protein
MAMFATFLLSTCCVGDESVSPRIVQPTTDIPCMSTVSTPQESVKDFNIWPAAARTLRCLHLLFGKLRFERKCISTPSVFTSNLSPPCLSCRYSSAHVCTARPDLQRNVAGSGRLVALWDDATLTGVSGVVDAIAITRVALASI